MRKLAQAATSFLVLMWNWNLKVCRPFSLGFGAGRERWIETAIGRRTISRT
jgi:hypothetical protein